MRYRILTVLIASLLLLAACSPTATPTPAPAPSATSVPPSTSAAEAAPTAAMEATSPPPAEPAAPETGIQTFRLLPEESQAAYVVEEEFLNGAVERLGKTLGLFNATGATQQVEGTLSLDLTDPAQPSIVDGMISVQIVSLQSDDNRRDDRIRERFLESNRYPTAIFVPTSLEGFPGDYQPGGEASFTLAGDLTIREVTQPVRFDTTATLDGDRLTGTATATILMTDFGFNPPEIPGVLRAQNEVQVTMSFTAVAE